MTQLDTWLFLGVNGAIPPWLGVVLLGVTYAGSFYAVGVSMVIIVAAARRRRRLGLAYIASAVVTAFVFGQLVKHSIARVRPWRVFTGAHTYGPSELGFSFPSGHTTTAFSVAIAIGLWWPRTRWPTLAVAVLVGFSRVAIGMHYPGDVIGGAILGTVTSVCLFPLFARWARRGAAASPPGAARPDKDGESL